jgi:hypothetical protein
MHREEHKEQKGGEMGMMVGEAHPVVTLTGGNSKHLSSAFFTLEIPKYHSLKWNPFAPWACVCCMFMCVMC